MSTPSKGVRAPFKSPLRPKPENAAPTPTSPGTKQLQNEIQQKASPASTDQSGYSQERLSQLTEQISQLTHRLCQLRETEDTEINVQQEYDAWRERMHNYNDVKDVCLELFDRLANVRGCLVRQIYSDYGLQPDD